MKWEAIYCQNDEANTEIFKCITQQTMQMSSWSSVNVFKVTR